MRKWRCSRPKFAGRAAFKTFLKRNGFKVPRDFYGLGSAIAARSGRLWRFRFKDWVVDVSCPLSEFDRWANSTDDTIGIEDFKEFLKCHSK